MKPRKPTIDELVIISMCISCIAYSFYVFTRLGPVFGELAVAIFWGIILIHFMKTLTTMFANQPVNQDKEDPLKTERSTG